KSPAPPEVRVVSANPVTMVPAVATNTTSTTEPAMTPERAAYLRAQSDLLFKLGMRSDSESYQTIVSELTNSEKIIRSEALDAAIQFGNRDVIPYLKELAARTEDPYEKVALLEAAEYIALPSLTEVRQQRKLQQASQPDQTPHEPRAPRTNRFRNFRGASVPPAPPPQP
ncbi:MAG: HEAT repeat domain-containing protein, partial [Verrucomicrobiota bacterium]